MKQRRSSARDHGFSLVEILIVVVILGVLASVAVFAVRGTTDTSTENGCESDRKSLVTMVESYFALHPQREIPATGTGADRFERTMVEAQIMRATSINHDVMADGEIVAVADGLCDV